jgi:predicted nucleotidyltransferase
MSIDKVVMQTSQALAGDYRKAFGAELISVILYGSAVSGDYLPKKSDLNYLIVLSEDGMERLHLAHGLVARWRKKKVATPLFLTKAYIESSVDTFPIEFINIKRNHLLIFGENVLEKLTFTKSFVRLQCERELKGKLLLLRKSYVETGGKAGILRKLITDSVPTFIFVFKGLLYLLDREVPATMRETVRLVAEELHLDEALFLSLLEAREGGLRRPARQVEEMFQGYVKEIRTLALRLDAEDFGTETGSGSGAGSTGQ